MVVGRAGHRELPPAYVNEHVELAYATTVYGAQGDTVGSAHLLIGETTGAAAAYVGMTRGREDNTAHLVAGSIDDARRQWITIFGRGRADLGPAHAAKTATADIDRYGAQAPRRPSVRPPGRHASHRRTATTRATADHSGSDGPEDRPLKVFLPEVTARTPPDHLGA